MASANVELVLSIFNAWERGDYGPTAWADPEIEFVIDGGPTPGSRRGIAGMAQGWTEFLSAWEGHRSQAESHRELDEERVLVFAHATGRAKRSGVEFTGGMVKPTVLFHVRDQRVTRLIIYHDRKRALAELGLASEADSADW